MSCAFSTATWNTPRWWAPTRNTSNRRFRMCPPCCIPTCIRWLPTRTSWCSAITMRALPTPFSMPVATNRSSIWSAPCPNTDRTSRKVSAGKPAHAQRPHVPRFLHRRKCMVPVILSGGSGSRLWPLSRTLYPKQFLALTGQQTLFQQTLKRLERPGMAAPVIVCNEAHRFIVAEQMQAIGCRAQAVLLEPFGRNTAPAVALAAMRQLNEGQDDWLLVLPADHVIGDLTAFRQALDLAEAAVEQGRLALFGIP